MQKDFYFKQRIEIKKLLSLTKTPLIKSAEELNYRLWNLSSHLERKWHNVEEVNWKTAPNYYLKSFTYRFLSFLYWTIKAEESIYSLDLKQADSEDALYLKYIKTLKHFFCERDLLDELVYKPEQNTNHFYKDHLGKFSNYLNQDGKFISFEEFEEKFMQNSDSIRFVIKYITNIDNDEKNLNYNVIKCFHLFLMLFLNKYGLDYHYTSKKKLKDLMKEKYNNIKIKKGFYNFLERNKVLKEAKIIVKTLDLSAAANIALPQVGLDQVTSAFYLYCAAVIGLTSP
jgi:hypothetical protein